MYTIPKPTEPKFLQRWFRSPSEFVAYAREKGLERFNYGYERAWYGGRTFSETEKVLHKGDPRHIKRAEEILSEITRGVNLASLRSQWVSDMHGAYPDVAAYMANDPAYMRRRTRVTDNIAPMKIVISTSVSAGIPTDAIVKRGICLLALVIALSRVRPVEAYAACSHGNRDDYIIRLPTQPPDLGTICFCLVDPSFDRGLMIALNQHVTGDSWIQWGTGYEDPKRYFGLGPSDYGFRGMHLEDSCWSNPLAWVKEHITKILGKTSEEIEELAL